MYNDKVKYDGQTDGPTDGRMDGWTDGRTDGWTDGQTDRWTNKRMDEEIKVPLANLKKRQVGRVRISHYFNDSNSTKLYILV